MKPRQAIATLRPVQGPSGCLRAQVHPGEGAA
jgi:hypothetical protein